MINSITNKISREVLELIEDKIKDLLYYVNGYNKSMSIEETIDLLNSSNKWIECTDEDVFRKYILKNRKDDKAIAMFLVKHGGIEYNSTEHSYSFTTNISDIFKL